MKSLIFTAILFLFPFMLKPAFQRVRMDMILKKIKSLFKPRFYLIIPKERVLLSKILSNNAIGIAERLTAK